MLLREVGTVNYPRKSVSGNANCALRWVRAEGDPIVKFSVADVEEVDHDESCRP